MNPLVKKEIRLLLPAWVAAILLAIASLLLTIGHAGIIYLIEPIDLNILCLLFGGSLLGIASFGPEFSSGTFTLLLSQPIERRRIWFIKTTVLALAFASVLLTLLVPSELYYFHLLLNWRIVLTILKFVGFTALCAFALFSSGLWTTLLVRRISEAFWLTLLTPVILMAMVFAFSDYLHLSNRFNIYFVSTILLLYSLAGFFWARRLFLRAQDLQWTGGEILFPSRKGILERTTVSGRRRHWLSALVWKELQLQQVNILIAAVVLALHLASVAVRQVHPNFGDPNIRGLLELSWMLWLAMPLLIGSAAVAEEHRVGVLESQFCLPVSRRVQFAVKFFTTLILSLVLGGLMPFIVERGHDLNYYIFILAAAIFFISFYASTVSRTTIQAIGVAIVVAVAFYFYALATAMGIFKLGHSSSQGRAGLELLNLYLGVPILLLALGALTYWNFKWLHPESKLRWRNGLAVLAAFAFIFIATNAIYFRAWEFLTPIEPPHGPARLSDSKQVKLAATQNTIFVTLPDGKLWVNTLAFDQAFQLAPKQAKSEFIGGSNWIAVTADNYQALGIQSNGSLWSLQRQWNPLQNLQWQTGAFRLARIGSETNWAQVAGGRLGFLLLKEDGTLWIWGTNGYSWRDLSNSFPRKLKLDLVTPPVRTGAESNWVEVFTSSDQSAACAKQSDGGILKLSGEWKMDFQNVHLQSTNTSSEWMSFVSQGWADVGVRTNGELWLSLNDWTNNTIVPGGKIQLGQGSKWQIVSFDNFNAVSVIAIRNDGTLWEWPVSYTIQYNPVASNPVQLGNHSDWLTLFRCWPRTVALAADGSLWTWDEPSGHVWLAPSRKPVYLGNIFTAR